MLWAMTLAPIAELHAQQPKPKSAAKTPAQAGATYAPYHRQPSRDALKWADRELRRMTLDEKIGHMIAVGLNATYLNQ